MKVSELGQFGLIDVVSKMIEWYRDDQVDAWKNLVTGVGDDCAVWRGILDNQLAKVDCQVQGVHFNLDIISWEDLGWKSLAINLSDIAAMGGIPKYALISLGLPLDTEVEDVVSLYKGILNLARLSEVAIVGGNMSRSPVVFVDVNLMGITGNPEGKFLTRSSALPGELIGVTGHLGTASAGLEMLTRELEFASPISTCLRKAFARPEPRLSEGRLLIEKGVKTGMDISDGLLSDLGHICKTSQVGARLELERIPIIPAVKLAFGQKSLELALSGGEDYQLLFTATPDIMEKVITASSYPITVIGEVLRDNVEEIILVDSEGNRYQPVQYGWDHFKSK